MDGYSHRCGHHGLRHWRGFEPVDPEGRWVYTVGACRCGHGPHVYRVPIGAGQGHGYEVTGEGEKQDRIAFLEYEIKLIKNCLESRMGELDRLKGEQGKGT